MLIEVSVIASRSRASPGGSLSPSMAVSAAREELSVMEERTAADSDEERAVAGGGAMVVVG